LKKLLITTGGGLGNRLLGLASAMVLSRRHGIELQVYWPVGEPGNTGTSEGFHCEFDQLYIPPCEFVTQLECNKMLARQHRHYSLKSQLEGICPVADDGVTYFYTHGAIKGTATPAELQHELLTIRPGSQLRNRLLAAKVLMDDRHYDGMMVRCHGHPKARRWNSLVKFQQLLRHDHHGSFYLSCDDHDTSVRLAGSRHRTVMLPRPWKRNSCDELMTVAADLMMLIDSDTLYATPFSALTEFLRVMRGSRPVVYPE